jgi:hypothetical protein
MQYCSAMKSKASRIPQGKFRSFRRGSGTRGETMRHAFRWRARGFFRWTPCWAHLTTTR